MRQAGDGLHFPLKTSEGFRVGEKLLPNHFERDNAVLTRVPCLEDLTDPALAQPIANEVRAIDQLLRSADKDLVHLKYAEPAALDQILGQRSHITEARAQHAMKLIE